MHSADGRHGGENTRKAYLTLLDEGRARDASSESDAFTIEEMSTAEEAARMSLYDRILAISRGVALKKK